MRYGVGAARCLVVVRCHLLIIQAHGPTAKDVSDLQDPDLKVAPCILLVLKIWLQLIGRSPGATIDSFTTSPYFIIYTFLGLLCMLQYESKVRDANIQYHMTVKTSIHTLQYFDDHTIIPLQQMFF